MRSSSKSVSSFSEKKNEEEVKRPRSISDSLSLLIPDDCRLRSLVQWRIALQSNSQAIKNIRKFGEALIRKQRYAKMIIAKYSDSDL